MLKKRLNISFNLQVSIFREGDAFVAYSPMLDLSTSGENFDMAKKRFDKVVRLFFEELAEKGTLDDVLTELGWQKERAQWFPPVLVSQDTEKFDFKF